MTLNQIIHKLFKPVAEDHLQLNDFGYGNVDQLSANHTVKYPLMWLIVRPVSYGSNTLNYSFSVMLCDKVNADHPEQEADIQSDMIQVAADVAAKLVNLDMDGIDVDRAFTLQPFTDRFTDVCAGVVMDITIKVDKYLNDCKTASKDNLL